MLDLYFRLICDNKDIVFAWVQGRVGIRGNSVVDLAAKHALEKPVNTRLAVPYSDFKVLTNMYTKKLWQTEWERHPETKLYKIQPKVDDPIPSHGRCHREESVLCRLHIGHTFLTHFYVLKGEELPICIPCDHLQHVRSSGPGAIVCKSRATHRALITCKCHVTRHLVRRDSSAIKFDRVAIAFI